MLRFLSYEIEKQPRNTYSSVVLLFFFLKSNQRLEFVFTEPTLRITITIVQSQLKMVFSKLSTYFDDIDQIFIRSFFYLGIPRTLPNMSWRQPLHSDGGYFLLLVNEFQGAFTSSGCLIVLNIGLIVADWR